MRRRCKIIYTVIFAAAILLSGCRKIDDLSLPVSVSVTSGSDMNEPSDKEVIRIEMTDESENIPVVYREPDIDAFHEKLIEIREKNGVYGMGVALFRDGEIICTDSLGYADMEKEVPVTENTIFRAASVSKLISTIPVMTLVDKGLLDSEGDLSEQTGIMYEVPQSGTIKLWHLLTHTAGITDTYQFEVLSLSRKYSTDEVIESAHTGVKAGTVYNYTNLGAGTMGSIVERLTGKYFHDYAEEVMFAPLGMDAGYVIDKIKDKGNCALIYDHDGEIFNVPTWGRTQYYYESFGLGNSYLMAQCELLIKAKDLALIGIALAGDGTVNGYRILSEKSIKMMHSKYFDNEDFGMGLNVRIYDGNIVEGRIICGHPGNALGAICGLFYDRSDRTGVAILTNRCNLGVKANSVYTMLDSTIKAAYEHIF